MVASNDFLVLVDETNKSSLHEAKLENIMYYFELKEWFALNAFRSFSVKMVIDGEINYKIGSTIYPVKKNQFLIGNKQPDVKSYFDSKEPIKSICLNIQSSTIAEAYSVMTSRKKIDLDSLISRHFNEPFFPERVYNIEHSGFMGGLYSVAKTLALREGENIKLNEEFFLEMSEQIVRQLFETSQSYRNLASSKAVTKKEILRRLDLAKNYLEENYLAKPSVAELAGYCNMSEFHFFRSFKQAFRITPYQLQLKLRLEKARELMVDPSLPLTHIANKCAFPGLSTFSKAYKRMYNISPSDDHDRYR